MANNYDWELPILDNYFQSNHLSVDRILEVGSRDALDGISLSHYYKCSVDLFEPDPLNIFECKRNIAQLAGESVINLHEIALGEQTGPVDFYSVDPD